MSQVHNSEVKIKNIDEINDIISGIDWVLNDSLKSIKLFDLDYDHTKNPGAKIKNLKVPKSLLETKMPIEKNDRVGIFAEDDLLTELIRGDTIGDFLKAIAKGLKSKPNRNNEAICEYVNLRISNFCKEMQLKLTKDFEDGKLKYSDLLGDHIFFEAGLKRENGIWTYRTGS
ncbi:MAG: hypothetical protein Hyperionvirus19_34 [Hyperionvirus sp.]|uniref:Uncharacterized protein n=1 Tax=Hyperionvirus sp. TaxID=2487770 RepID=A0A3G5AAE3_9VIRU|nr:MAG: hypothetical protein Hyperionvirus19_34 [Hyperionvirus sp.]